MLHILQPSLARSRVSWALILYCLVVIQLSQSRLANTEFYTSYEHDSAAQWDEKWRSTAKHDFDWQKSYNDDQDDEQDDDYDDDDDEEEDDDYDGESYNSLSSAREDSSVPLDDDIHFGPKCDVRRFGYVCRNARECGNFPLNKIGGEKRDRYLIIDGLQAKAGEWPSFAQVMTSVTHCSAVIVSRWHVITADHCVRDDSGNVDPNITIHVGTHHVLDTPGYWNDTNRVTRKVDKTCPHDEQDLAVLLLDQPLFFNDYIQPACYSLKHRALPPMEGQASQCYAIGNGLTRFANQDEWRESLGAANNQSALVTNYKQIERWPLSVAKCSIHREPNLFCMGSPSGYAGGTCFGDSGGPVMCLGLDSRWTLVGITVLAFQECQWPSFGNYLGEETALVTADECRQPMAPPIKVCERATGGELCALSTTCGQRYANTENPFFAIVEISQADGSKRYCGATIITSSELISSKLCVTRAPSEADNWPPVAFASTKVIVGPFKVVTGANGDEAKQISENTKLSVKTIETHTKFNYKDSQRRKSLARIVLESAVTFNEQLQPACWPYTLESKTEFFSNKDCIAVGLVGNTSNVIEVPLEQVRCNQERGKPFNTCFQRKASNEDKSSPMGSAQVGGPVLCKDDHDKYALYAVILEADQEPEEKCESSNCGRVIYASIVHSDDNDKNNWQTVLDPLI